MVYSNYGSANNTNSTSSADQNKKIFLGGLNYNTTDETLQTFCSRFGKMTDCVVMRTAEGKSRGFGFVTFEESSAVEEFMRARPHTIDNRQIDAKRAMPREDQNSAESHLTVKKLFVGGLRDGIDEPCLTQYFSRFGNVTEVLIMNDRDGKPRGFAFVSFDDYDAVDKAILEKPHSVNGRTLDVKKAVPKDKMQDMGPSTGNNSGKPSQRNSSGPGPRNNYGQMPDNYDNSGNNWNNSNYNQPPPPNYGQQGYNQHMSGFNGQMPSNNSGFSSSYGSMGPNQPPPPPPPPPAPQQSMVGYGQYPNNNNNPNMPYGSGLNQSANTNFMPPPPAPYGSNQQTGYNTSSSNFGNMNNPFNAQTQPPSNTGTNNYAGGPSMPGAFDPNPYDMSGNTYNPGGSNYSESTQQQSRGGGPMRGKRGRGGGPSGNFPGNNNPSNRGNRAAPYPPRGGGRGGNTSNFGGRGRGRGQ